VKLVETFIGLVRGLGDFNMTNGTDDQIGFGLVDRARKFFQKFRNDPAAQYELGKTLVKTAATRATTEVVSNQLKDLRDTMRREQF